MTIHPAPSPDAPDASPVRPTPLQQADTTDARADSTAYDSVWTESQAEIPVKQPEGLERVMLADGKIYVVLAVVLVIWFGLVAYLFRTDRKLDALERRVDATDSTSPTE